MKTETEFWAWVDIPSVNRDEQCWLWKGSVDSRGYGNLKWGHETKRAHRLAFAFVNGPIAREDSHHGRVVMHKCDNRRCCNPSHLRLGSQAENAADMQAKGRRKGIGTGASNGRAKLTADQVAAIRCDTRGKRKIAPEYGISPAQVQRIRNGEQWA